ncbi:unnamed protein product, partial [Ectocarpus fasciculatus]
YRNDWYVITTAISFHTCSVRARMLFFCIRTNFNLLTHKHQLTSRPSVRPLIHSGTGLQACLSVAACTLRHVPAGDQTTRGTAYFFILSFLFWCPNISPCVACRCKNIYL